MQHLRPRSTCEPFSGTGAVSYLFKAAGCSVHANDHLECNAVAARAVVVNSDVTVSDAVAAGLMDDEDHGETFRVMRRYYEGVYYTDEENAWLDRVVERIHERLVGAQRDLALFALFQAALIKRPYNLFHRANLYMRLADVSRGFGNKRAWDAPFSVHMARFLEQANGAVFDNGRQHKATTLDYRELRSDADLLYIDPPYLNGRGQGIDYLDFYHVLEGITRYRAWPDGIDMRFRHRPYRDHRARSLTTEPDVRQALDHLVAAHPHAAIVVSYRSDGRPSVDELVALLRRHGREDVRVHQNRTRFALSRAAASEVLLVAPG